MNKLVLTLAIGALFCANGVFAVNGVTNKKLQNDKKASELLGDEVTNKIASDAKKKRNAERVAAEKQRLAKIAKGNVVSNNNPAQQPIDVH